MHLHSLPLKKSEAAIVPIGCGHIALIWDQSLRSSEHGIQVCAIVSEVVPRPAHTPTESIANTRPWHFLNKDCCNFCLLIGVRVAKGWKISGKFPDPWKTQKILESFQNF